MIEIGYGTYHWYAHLGGTAMEGELIARDLNERTSTMTDPTATVPPAWYAAEDHAGAVQAWEHLPAQPHLPRAVSDRELAQAGVQVGDLPRMQWGVLFGGEVSVFASESQARVTFWDVDAETVEDMRVELVRRLPSTVWIDDSTGRQAGHVGRVTPSDDRMVDPVTAHNMIWCAARWVASGTDPDAADHLAALRREATAHGHDVTALEG